MKKILYSIFGMLFVLFPVSVLAEGYISVSPGSLTIEQGSSKTFTITAYNAIGDVTISSNDSSIASVSTGSWGTGMVGEKETKSGTITVTGNSVGTTTITLVIDGATFDRDDLSDQIKIININVVSKVITLQPSNPKPAPQPSTPQNNLSNNNNVKSLNVEGYELLKVDNNNYTLTVSNDVTSINLNASAEDSKATVSGTGNHNLNIGENNIGIIITSESGIQNIINIKITRKDGYYLDDLEKVLKNDKLKDVDIIISNDSKITKNHIDKIKKSKKTLRLNYYDENKKLVYSWTVNGKEIKQTKEFEPLVTYTSEKQKEIYKLSNYADGLNVNFKHNGELPEGTKIKLYVGDKFEDGSIINVYHYNSTKKTLDFIKENIKVIDGYIEFEIEHCSEYFITMSVIENSIKTNQSVNIFMILTIILTIIIIGLVSFIFIKLKSNKNENSIDISTTIENNNNTVNDTEIIQQPINQNVIYNTMPVQQENNIEKSSEINFPQ